MRYTVRIENYIYHVYPLRSIAGYMVQVKADLISMDFEELTNKRIQFFIVMGGVLNIG